MEDKSVDWREGAKKSMKKQNFASIVKQKYPKKQRCVLIAERSKKAVF